MCRCVSVCSQTGMGITNTNSEEILKMKRKKIRMGLLILTGQHTEEEVRLVGDLQ